jgi:glyoxylase-like metal-dependent hydrolase (beta-lactamase superfamily II)
MKDLGSGILAHEVDAIGFPTLSVAVVTRRRLFIVDTLMDVQSVEPMRTMVEEREGRRVVVVNTHYHWDHVYGNAAFADHDIVAHRSCGRLIESQMRSFSERVPPPPREGVPLPTITFGDRLTYAGDDETLNLIHTPGHTEDSIVVYLDQARVLLAGDTLEYPLPGFHLRDGRDVWVRTLRQLKQLPAERIVPSHGPAMGKELIDLNERYIAGLYAAVAEQKAAGTRRDEVEVPPEQLIGAAAGDMDETYRDAHRENLEWAYDDI